MDTVLARCSSKRNGIGVADFGVATDGYFQVLGIPLIRGRLFDEHDGASAPHVAVVSESLARDRWPNQDPIGHTIEFGNMDGDLRLLTIVGIVGDIHDYGLDAPPRPTVYVNLLQRPPSAITVTMLSDADTRPVSSTARGILQDLDPEIPDEVPDVYAGVFRFAGLAKIQRDSHRIFRNHGAAAGNGGGVRCDGIFGEPSDAGDWRACRAGGGLRRRFEDDFGAGIADDLRRRGDWDYWIAGIDAHRGVIAVWRDGYRSGHIRWGDAAVGRRSAVGLLRSGAAGDQSGPTGCVAVRIKS